MLQRRRLKPYERVLASAFAVIWIGAGLAGIAWGLLGRGSLVIALAGLLGVAYGVVWQRVALTGRAIPMSALRRKKRPLE
jgi:hypothetical protein